MPLDSLQRIPKYSHAIPHLKIPAFGRILSVMQDSGPKLAHDRAEPDGARRSAVVLPFRPRGLVGQGPASHPLRPAAQSSDDESEPFDDLAQYEQDREQQDESVNYPHRMLMNIIAVTVLTILIGAGVWLADTITYMERNQDCILQGRQNCAPLEIAAPVRK
jgi:hypothetical protein